VLTIAEMGQYSYVTTSERSRDPSEEPIAQNNHALDALRYLAHSELGQVRTTDAYLEYFERTVERMEEEAREAVQGSENYYAYPNAGERADGARRAVRRNLLAGLE
jgi:hypothetical protein